MMKSWFLSAVAMVSVLVLGLSANSAFAADASPFDQKMAQLSTSYLKISDTLAKDSMVGVDEALQSLLSELPNLKVADAPVAQQEGYADLPALITAGAQGVLDAKTLADKREAFKALSKPFARWATVSKPGDVQLVYCSMAKGSWLQEKGPVENPYYGAEMLRCGQIIAGQ